jgi:hypothetical protein
LQRGSYDYWRGFGSDGYAGLYDFVKRGEREGGYYGYHGPVGRGARNIRPFVGAEPAKKSRYNYWRGFGSDGEAGLYDFMKK